MAAPLRERTTEICVAGMDCAACQVTIAENLRQLDGVHAVEVDWRSGVARITYDQARGADEALFRQRIEALGFIVLPEGPHNVGAHRTAAPSPLRLLLGFLVLLPVLFAFRDRLAYMPGQNAAFVPAWLNQEIFSAASAAAVAVAFLAGVATFFSPSMVAVVGVVLGYTAGTAQRDRRAALGVAGGFAAGLILVDGVMGAAYGGVGKVAIRFFTGHLAGWNLLIASVLIAVSLVMLRVWRLPGRHVGERLPDVPGFRGALMLSAPFGLLDCPGCNPLLLPVAVGVAATGSPLFGAIVLSAFGFGRAVLLMVAGGSAGVVKQWRGLARVLPVVETAGGWLLLLAGLYFIKEFLRLVEISGL